MGILGMRSKLPFRWIPTELPACIAQKHNARCRMRVLKTGVGDKGFTSTLPDTQLLFGVEVLDGSLA